MFFFHLTNFLIYFILQIFVILLACSLFLACHRVLSRLGNQFGFQFLFSEPANAAAAAPSDFCANTWRGSWWPGLVWPLSLSLSLFRSLARVMCLWVSLVEVPPHKAKILPLFLAYCCVCVCMYLFAAFFALLPCATTIPTVYTVHTYIHVGIKHMRVCVWMCWFFKQSTVVAMRC